mgnify:CR=1 FL=1
MPDNRPMPSALRLLALETSTDTLSVALGTGAPDGVVWQHSGPGGAMVFSPAFVQARPGDTIRFVPTNPGHNAETIAGPLPDQPFRDELVHLWHFANACEGRRGKPSATQGINDYNFAIDGDLADPDACTVEISERKRGSPLDKLVAELMIVANSTWGGLLAEKRSLEVIYEEL